MFSIVVTSTINYRQSWKSSNCEIEQTPLLLLCSCRSLLGSTLLIGNLFYLSYPFHLLFLCWATFHYSFMQPKFQLEKDKQTNHDTKAISHDLLSLFLSPVGTWTPAYISLSEKMLSHNYQEVKNIIYTEENKTTLLV